MIRPSIQGIKTHLCQQDLAHLLEHQQNPSLSIYLPAAQGEQQIAVFERALSEAESRLDAFEFEPRATRFLLDRLQRYSNQPTFWKQSCKGLALYLSADCLLAYQCPTHQHQVRVDDYFHVLPLLTHFLTQQPFYLLWSVDAHFRLFSAGSQCLYELPLNHPAGSDKPEALMNALQQHLAESYLSQLSPLVIVTAEVAQFETLEQQLRASGLHTPCFHLEPEHPPEDMYHLARNRVDALLAPEHQQLLDRYLALREMGRTVADLMALTRAAYNSRVSTLFLVTDYEHQEELSLAQDHHADILNRATIYTYLNGGRICAVGANDLLGAKRAAAILRY